MRMRNDITIRPERRGEEARIAALVLRSFREGTDYSDGTDVVAFLEEIRASAYYLPELSFVAERGQELVGHFMFSKFPLSPRRSGGHGGPESAELLMLAPVAVHADHLRQGVGSAMLALGVARAKKQPFRGILLEGNYLFYNGLGFSTSSDFGIYPTAGRPLADPRCMMCMETRPGSLRGVHGYVVYDMYANA